MKKKREWKQAEKKVTTFGWKSNLFEFITLWFGSLGRLSSREIRGQRHGAGITQFRSPTARKDKRFSKASQHLRWHVAGAGLQVALQKGQLSHGKVRFSS